MEKKASIDRLIREVRAYYKKSGRTHLPWRGTVDPYKILVSEMMLQQTQVSRVIPYYEQWIKKFPTAKKLANAKLSDVLKMWQGLGYNRRAKYLHDAAKVMSAAKIPAKKSSGLPSRDSLFGESSRARLFSREFFAALPGVGPYTASAVEIFAFNKPNVCIETNVRSVFLYFCFAQNSNKVADKDIEPLVAEALKKSKMPPREFYWALMDYGSYLKGKGIKLNSRSKHYAKQSKFEGSRRQKRAAALRKLLAKGASEKDLLKVLHSK